MKFLNGKKIEGRNFEFEKIKYIFYWKKIKSMYSDIVKPLHRPNLKLRTKDWSVFSFLFRMRQRIKTHKIIYRLSLFIYFLFKTIYYYTILLIFSVFKIENKIIIVNYSGKGYWDMGKYICNELIKYNHKIYRATKEEYKDSLPMEINYVKYDSIKYLYHLATAKVWINNSRFQYWIRKRKKQFYIQTWHWCLAFKKVESAVEDKLSRYYVWGAKNDSKIANLFISNSTFCTNFYRKYFWYNWDILEDWCPRNDIIINNDKGSILKVKKYFWILETEKICLYAPTFRVDSLLDAYNIDYDILIKALENKFKNKWKLLIRLHPNISYLGKQLSWIKKNIINASDYPDMQELLVATDFLITDYSSCILDYALSQKPWIIYASDIEKYKKDRDFDIKLEDTPFPIATDNLELEQVLENFKFDEYKDKVRIFYDNLGLKETGKSCKEIVWIINKIMKNKK